jgi:hypothetical protein
VNRIEELRAFVLFALLAASCDDPLKRTELIEEPRVLGARVEVEGAPERAAPRPGERARIRFLIAAPELEPALGFAFVACRSAPANVGLPACKEPAFAEGVRAEPAPGAPELEFVLPEPSEPEVKPRLLVRGVICPNGSPRVSALPSTCASGGQALEVALEIDLATENDENQNPSFAAADVRLDGEPFEPAATLDAECAASGLPEVRAASEHGIVLDFEETVRDQLRRESSRDPLVESILISHFASAGELERAFSPVAPEAEAVSANVGWTAPKGDIPDEGLLVRFWFVVRDLRGGSDFAERAVCVLP